MRNQDTCQLHWPKQGVPLGWLQRVNRRIVALTACYTVERFISPAAEASWPQARWGRTESISEVARAPGERMHQQCPNARALGYRNHAIDAILEQAVANITPHVALETLNRAPALHSLRVGASDLQRARIRRDHPQASFSNAGFSPRLVTMRLPVHR